MRRYISLASTFAVCVLLYGVGMSQFPAFATTRVMGNLLTDNAFLGIVAIGMTFVILSGGIDLSVGSVIAFTSVFCAVVLRDTTLHPLVVFALALVLGALFGAAMGAIIHYLEIPAFIVTLSGMFFARGMAFVLNTDSIPISHPFYGEVAGFALRFPDKGRLTLLGMIFLLVLLAGIYLAHFTRFGRNVYAIGGNADAALLMGVPMGRMVVSIYALSSFLAALAGVVFSLYTQAGYSLSTVGVELDAIAAVVIGGTLLRGGEGFVIGTFIGIVIQGLIQTYITFDGSLNSWWTKIFIGLLLFAFIVLQKLLSRQGARRPQAVQT